MEGQSEGRRVTRRNQKYNPLFILFLCLVSAVAILFLVSVVLGIRLGSTSKKLKAAEEQVKTLTEDVSRLEAELADAKTVRPDDPKLPSEEAAEAAGGGSTSDASWLDFSSHSEIKVKPTNLLDSFAKYYTTAGVNVRSGPATSYERITTVEYGEAVQVAAREGGWSFVKYGSNTYGWISSDYLSTSEPTGAASTQARPSSSGSRTEATSGSLKR